MKYLLLLAIIVFVVWGLRKVRLRGRAMHPAPRPPERMVRCEVCGVNVPVSESLLVNGRRYCSAAHRDQAARSTRD
ncbi:PP0621 family protein [Propionivibrio limicola]|uniref:PP0621 family protein n=1 Tax=Propionivibrio limicola TaxID=167645 RepID=UPI0012927A23|nr:PP0621 family protein [Propionivibrio limicola]